MTGPDAPGPGAAPAASSAGAVPAPTTATTPAAPAPASVDPALAQRTELRSALDGLHARPDLALIVGGQAPADPTEVTKLLDEYEQVPPGQDRQALQLLVTKVLDLGQRRTLGAAERQAVAAENHRRVEQARTEVRTATESFVQRVAPDVVLDLFWAKVNVAEREIPAELAGPEKTRERMDWTAKRAIQLARHALGPRAAGAPGAASAAAAEPPRNMVSQLRALQDKRGL